MGSKKWIVFPAAVLALAVCCCAAFNMLVDPFGVFGDPVMDWYGYNNTAAPGVAKPAWLERHGESYDSYLVGAVSAYRVETLNACTDASFYDLSTYGGDVDEYRAMAAYALERGQAERLVLSLRLDDCGAGGTKGPLHPLAGGGSLPLAYAKYALTTVRQCLDKLDCRGRDTELPQTFDRFLADTGGYDWRARDVEKVGDPAAYDAAHAADFVLPEGEDTLPGAERCLQMVAEIRDLCREYGAELTVILSPVYAPRWERCGEERIRSFMTGLAEVTDFWDFSLTPVSYDSRYFYDAGQFRTAVGDMVLAEIFGGTAYRPEGFGALVTAENCRDHLDGLYTGQLRPEREDYTADVPILLYHHIAPGASDFTTVSPETFAAHMRFLAENGCHAVTLQEMINYVYYGGTLPEKAVCITFDDGYLSNYQYGWPLLERYGMKAVIFPIGVSVGHTKYYKDTKFIMTPHFSYEQAREMIASGTVDVQSHTYDMHQWAPFETGDHIRQDIRPFADESDDAYIAALEADIALYNGIAQEELGRPFTAIAYPGGEYTELTEVVVHRAGIPVTLSTRSDSRNILVRGLPQSLFALCRWYMAEETTEADILAVLGLEK